jgi:hypothetical protein
MSLQPYSVENDLGFKTTTNIKTGETEMELLLVVKSSTPEEAQAVMWAWLEIRKLDLDNMMKEAVWS